MDRPFYFLVGGAAVIGFATVWAATGVALAPPPAPIIVAPPPPPSGPANPDAASPLTVPIRVDGATASSGSGPIGPLDPAALQPTPANGSPDSVSVAMPTPPQPQGQPDLSYAPPPPAPMPPTPPADAGGPVPQSPPAG